MNITRTVFVAAVLVLGLAGGWIASGLAHRGGFGGPGGHFGPGGPGGPGGPFGPGGPGGPQGPGGPIGAFFDELGVSATQRQQIQELEREARLGLTQRHAGVDAARREFEAALFGGDATRARERFTLLLDRKRDAELAHFEMMMRVHAVLTPEQLRQLSRLIKEHPPGGRP